MDIYPAIDMKGGKCVRLSQGRFEEVTTYSEDPVKMAKRWQNEGAKWLHIVDLDGARMGLPSTQNLEILRQILRQVGLPVQFGGGVRSAEIVERMLRIGVTRVVIGTVAAQDARLVEGLFTVYGEKVAVGVDARDGMVAVQGWQQQVGETAVAFIARMAGLGAKRFVFTDIARDGMLQGVNIPALAQVAAAAPNVPVIASGGVSTLADLDALLNLRATSAPNIEGVIIGKALYAGTVTLEEVLSRAAAAL
jgi:phosphoribosylformimino-5-aminoimidazole carboxamide ribotide isomerase